MKKYLHATWILLGIVALAFALRIYKVTDIPPALSWDEVSIGYNAYSILKTGRDEHNRFLPVDAFAAFGDYKPPLAIYLTVPAVAAFGLTELSVRLPSVIFGTLTVLVTYFLIAELFYLKSWSSAIALLGSFLLAISPWHLQLSRAGFEANIATFFVACGMWFLYRARRDSRFWIVCWIPFVASTYTFNSSRYFWPLFAFGYVLANVKLVRNQLKYVAVGIVLGILLLAPIAPHLLSKEARLRFTEVNIFNDYPLVFTANNRITQDGGGWWAKILHNRRVAFARSFAIHFLDHFQPGFLFIRGDGNPKFSIQDVGQLYLIEAPFLVIGVLGLFETFPAVAWFLLWWIVAAIAPASVARETPHALRIENSLPVWQIFTAYGLWQIMAARKKLGRAVIVGIIVVLYAGNFFYYLHNYYSHYAKEYSGEWQYGYREAIRYVLPLQKNYDRIVITEGIGRPYIYALFYEQTDPRAFWKTVDGSFDAAGFYNVYGFEKYRFTRQGIIESPGRTLYILPPHQVPANAHILKTVFLLNGNPALIIFDL